MKKVVFEEMVELETAISFYFIAPKEYLHGAYPEAEHATIWVECPINHVNWKEATVRLSPCKDGSDYDWNEVSWTKSSIIALLLLTGYGQKYKIGQKIFRQKTGQRFIIKGIERLPFDKTLYELIGPHPSLNLTVSEDEITYHFLTEEEVKIRRKMIIMKGTSNNARRRAGVPMRKRRK